MRPRLPAELIDAITEAVAQSPDPVRRAAVIEEIVRQAAEAVAWRHGRRIDEVEQPSVELIVQSAIEHGLRMRLRLRDVVDSELVGEELTPEEAVR